MLAQSRIFSQKYNEYTDRFRVEVIVSNLHQEVFNTKTVVSILYSSKYTISNIQCSFLRLKCKHTSLSIIANCRWGTEVDDIGDVINRTRILAEAYQ